MTPAPAAYNQHPHSLDDEAGEKEKVAYIEHEEAANSNQEVLETKYACKPLKTPANHAAFVDQRVFIALGRWTAAKTFWKAMVFCAILNLAAFNDGFQQQVPGNIIPMPGEWPRLSLGFSTSLI